MPEITPRLQPRSSGMPGFSLIELIIVILIASLFAALIFGQINFATKKKDKMGIFQLKKTRGILPGNAELVCSDRCRQCTVEAGDNRINIPSQFKPIKAYVLDDSGSPQEVDFGRVKEKKVCLRFHYYANGSTSQMILESEGKFYFVPSYFGNIEVFDDLDAATERWMHYRNQLDSMGTFF